MAIVTYSEPVFETIKNTTQPKDFGSVSSTTRIAIDGGESSVTAGKFCQALNYDVSSYIVGGKADPSVVWKNNRWETAGSKGTFVSISCDNGLTESIGEVNIANIGDLMLLLGIVIALLTMMISLLIFGRN